MIHAKGCASHSDMLCDCGIVGHFEQIEIDGDAIARIITRHLPLHLDWQHIRAAGEAAAQRLRALANQEPGNE